MVSNEYEQLSSEALEAARICANKYVSFPPIHSIIPIHSSGSDMNLPIGILSKLPAKKVSISVSAPTHTTLFASIRCCHVLVPIDCRLECAVHGASPTGPLPV